MKRFLAILLLSLIYCLPSVAQEGSPLDEEPTACETEIESTKNQVQSVNRITLVESGSMLYRDIQTSRPVTFTHSFLFLVGGGGGGNLLNSPVLMTSLASRILHNCSHVGNVVFGFNQTDQSEIYGKRDNGEVFPFKCVAVGEDIEPVWGEYVCP